MRDAGNGFYIAVLLFVEFVLGANSENAHDM